MSRTDNTRPYHVQSDDPSLPRIRVPHFGASTERYQDEREFEPVIFGGKNQLSPHGKFARRYDQRKTRARERQFAQRARLECDPESLDLLPARGEGRVAY